MSALSSRCPGLHREKLRKNKKQKTDKQTNKKTQEAGSEGGRREGDRREEGGREGDRREGDRREEVREGWLKFKDGQNINAFNDTRCLKQIWDCFALFLELQLGTMASVS